MDYETVIGLEVHVQLATNSKLFCQCPTGFGAPPNSQICPVCTGLPGVLPVANKKAVELLLRAALGLGCRVNKRSVFARKSYFYPDLPKGYQISQYELPLSEGGVLEIELNGGRKKKIRLNRIHIEEDAGKLLHSIGAEKLSYSLVDLNRTGIPLAEIVSEPDMSSPEEAHAYLTALKAILKALEVSDCDMEKGSLRCDANISLRPAGSKTLGIKAEVKNLNSFRGVFDALSFEIERQTKLLASGEKIVQETRSWDSERCVTLPMRSKEEAHDYRYFPDPDLVPLEISEDMLASLRKSLPELPEARRHRLMKDYKLSSYDAGVLVSDKALADYFEAAARKGSDPKLVCNWVTSDLLGRMNSEGKSIKEVSVAPDSLFELTQLITKGTISSKIARDVFEEMWKTGKAPEEIVKTRGLTQVSDTSQIEAWADEAISTLPKAVEDIRSGKEQAMGALVGFLMKKSKGKVNPQVAQKILKEKIAGNAKSEKRNSKTEGNPKSEK